MSWYTNLIGWPQRRPKPGPTWPPPKTPLSEMTRHELVGEAWSLNVYVTAFDTDETIRALIEARRAEKLARRG